MDEHTFVLNRERAVDYLNMLDRLYVFDGYAGWDPEVVPTPDPANAELSGGARILVAISMQQHSSFFLFFPHQTRDAVRNPTHSVSELRLFSLPLQARCLWDVPM